MTLYTVQEIAAILKLSVLTIYKYIKEGTLEAVEFGGHYRITKPALDSFILSHADQRPIDHDQSTLDIPSTETVTERSEE